MANFVSSLRFLFAAFLCIADPMVRCSAIVLAMVSDILDGFIARRFSKVSKLGTLLDPLSDKVFVLVALIVFFFEGKITALHIAAFLSREVSLLLFTLLLVLKREWKSYTIRAFFTGKVMTSLQFITLIWLAIEGKPIENFYWVLAFVGFSCFIELLQERRAMIIAK